MSDRSDVIYSYDGTFDGLMCCVFQCYTDRRMPCDIVSGVPDQIGFTQVVIIPTDIERAERVSRSIPLKWARALPILYARRSSPACRKRKCIYGKSSYCKRNSDLYLWRRGRERISSAFYVSGISLYQDCRVSGRSEKRKLYCMGGTFPDGGYRIFSVFQLSVESAST